MQENTAQKKPAKLVTIYVERPFRVQIGDERFKFAVGNHTVEQHVADHWFAKAHTGEMPETFQREHKRLDEIDATLKAKAAELERGVAELASRNAAIDQRAADIEAEATEVAARAKALDEREKAIAQREAAGAVAGADKSDAGDVKASDKPAGGRGSASK